MIADVDADVVVAISPTWLLWVDSRVSSSDVRVWMVCFLCGLR